MYAAVVSVPLSSCTKLSSSNSSMSGICKEKNQELVRSRLVQTQAEVKYTVVVVATSFFNLSPKIIEYSTFQKAHTMRDGSRMSGATALARDERSSVVAIGLLPSACAGRSITISGASSLLTVSADPV